MTRTWKSQPEMSDDAIREGTGVGWDEWCDRIEAWGGQGDGHGAIVEWLHANHDVNYWWAQGITVSFERITGLRLPHQKADGTFTAGKSKTIGRDAAELQAEVLSAEGQRRLFGDLSVEVKSKDGVKVPRIAVGPGVASIYFDPQSDGRTKVVIEHNKLPEYSDVETWKDYWDGWLERLSS